MKQAYHQPAQTPGERNRKRGGNPPVVVFVVAFLWLSVVVACMGWTLHYSYTPGRIGNIPGQWPAGSRIVGEASRPTLILFAHPKCPCTRASIGELARLMADCSGQLSAQVWFVKPADTAADWTNTDLWASAAAIPGVTVHADESGSEARRFQAETSGQTLLYDPTGRLLFQGGITISRGHAGDNAGLSAVENLVQGRLVTRIQTPVFGCSLFDDDCQPARAEAGKKP